MIISTKVRMIVISEISDFSVATVLCILPGGQFKCYILYTSASLLARHLLHFLLSHKQIYPEALSKRCLVLACRRAQS